MSYLTPTQLRSRFSSALSAMYRDEVPQYQTLLDLVEQVNQKTLKQQPDLHQALAARGELPRLALERHGAIRVGQASELAMLCRIFGIMGMHPVGYYDLSVAGVPVHSTAFRPVEAEELKQNPFRIFTSLLRLELIDVPALQDFAAELLSQRDIFTEPLKQLVVQAEQQGGLSAEDAERFVLEALETFRWHDTATVTAERYQALLQQHRLIADVLCFRGPHINHLTPRTLDIDAVQRLMPEWGITPKAVIEGPPARHCPILLRQTSFRALEEPIRFLDQSQGQHTARFGEIEQRGIALTPKGRALYDQLLNQSLSQPQSQDNLRHQQQLADIFTAFPDDEKTLRLEDLAYFQYRLVDLATLTDLQSDNLEDLIDAGVVQADPITYEDFLPVSAAGIFQSNLGDDDRSLNAGQAHQQAFEAALGCQVQDPFQLYAAQQQASLNDCLAQLQALRR